MLGAAEALTIFEPTEGFSAKRARCLEMIAAEWAGSPWADRALELIAMASEHFRKQAAAVMLNRISEDKAH